MEARTYEDALAVMQARGWSQFQLVRNDDGRVCALGAVCVAAGYMPYSHAWANKSEQYVQHMTEVLRANFDTPWTSVTVWNDSPSRTQEEVEELLRYCAKEAADEH